MAMKENKARIKGTKTVISPMLTVRNGKEALEFYKKSFGAIELSRLVRPDGGVVAELEIDGARFGVVDESREAHNLSPATLNGTTVRINLVVADPDAVAARAIAAGARSLFAVADQPYGWRQGRVVDPFGHHWLIGKPLETAPRK
jgi:PhnB protein